MASYTHMFYAIMESAEAPSSPVKGQKSDRAKAAESPNKTALKKQRTQAALKGSQIIPALVEPSPNEGDKGKSYTDSMDEATE